MRHTSVARFTLLSYVAVLLLLLGVLFGCGGGGQEGEKGASQEKETGAYIKATPNPVPTTGGEPSTTTISWSTGSEASSGEVYVVGADGREKLFAGGKQGSAEAPWIAAGKTYHFRLYAGTKRATLLDKVEVTRGEEQAFIKATPNPVPAGGGPQGKTTISWNTGEGGSWGQVYVSEDGAPEKLFAGGKQGSAEAPWIAAGKTHHFRLYAGKERTRLLDKVKVTRSVVESTTESTITKGTNGKAVGGVVGGVVPVQKGWSVSIQDSSFRPTNAAVEPGFTLTWINKGSESHTVTADDGTFTSGVLNPGDSFTVAFEERATLTYHCETHPSMVGSVTVG